VTAPCDRASLTELRTRAIRLLARREHTQAELLRKLAPHGAAEAIEQVIADLQQRGLQSDARFAESYLRSHAERLGPARLRQTLRNKGVGAELIDTHLAAAELPDEVEQARAVWARKFGEPPVDARDWARQARFLQGRGFSPAAIRRLLKDPAGDDASC